MPWIVIGAMVLAAWIRLSAEADRHVYVQAAGFASRARIDHGFGQAITTETVSLPWSKDLGDDYLDGEHVVLRVTNVSNDGHVTCRIVIGDNQMAGEGNDRSDGTAACETVAKR